MKTKTVRKKAHGVNMDRARFSKKEFCLGRVKQVCSYLYLILRK